MCKHRYARHKERRARAHHFGQHIQFIIRNFYALQKDKTKKSNNNNNNQIAEEKKVDSELWVKEERERRTGEKNMLAIQVVACEIDIINISHRMRKLNRTYAQYLWNCNTIYCCLFPVMFFSRSCASFALVWLCTSFQTRTLDSTNVHLVVFCICIYVTLQWNHLFTHANTQQQKKDTTKNRWHNVNVSELFAKAATTTAMKNWKKKIMLFYENNSHNHPNQCLCHNTLPSVNKRVKNMENGTISTYF